MISSQMEDTFDIVCRRNDFVGQVNNLLCYFRKLTSCVKYRLFRFYCTSFYGCELLSLTANKLQDLCTIWRIKACVQSGTCHSYVMLMYKLQLHKCLAVQIMKPDMINEIKKF